MKNKFLKLISASISLCLVVGAFVSCAGNGDTNIKSDGAAVQDNPREPQNVLAPKVEDKHLTPDVSNVKVPEASTKVTDCTTPEKFADALEAFVNPNGNGYDALSILGAFRYTQEGDELLKQMNTASKSWHEPIEEQVGEKCIVDVTFKEKTSYDLSDAVVTEWNAANGKTAGDYARIKCTFSTNYASDSVTYSFDIVNVDGNWYLAQTSILNKIQSLITTEIFR